MTVEVHIEDGVGTIALARPDRLNAFDEATIGAFAAAATRLANDADTRAILVTGQGRAFCAGLDLRFALVCSPGSFPPKGFLDGARAIARSLAGDLGPPPVTRRRAPCQCTEVVRG